MILYYAFGGGLGHLTRARAVAHTLQLEPPLLLLTASPWASDPTIRGPFELLQPPPALERNVAAFRRWLQLQIARFQPQHIYLDAFPAGIQGEWCELALDVPVTYLARRLRWPSYRPLLRGQPPTYTQTWLLEPLETAHRQFIADYSTVVNPLQLHDPPALAPAHLLARCQAIQRSGQAVWLIVHTGSAAEVQALLEYAKALATLEQADPQLVLMTPPTVPSPRWPGLEHWQVYPAWPLFSHANRIISAAGFNCMRQLAAYRQRHHCLPFDRRFDDQYARAAWVRQ